jgi:hypothetical protein
MDSNQESAELLNSIDIIKKKESYLLHVIDTNIQEES